MSEYKVIIDNLERLRINYGLEYEEIDSFAKLKSGTYKSVITNKIILSTKDLISIAKIYTVDSSKLFNPKMRMPIFKNLPEEIKKIASERLGKTEKIIDKKDLIDYCILIFNKHYKINEDFTNSQIKGHFKGELEVAFKGKSIEWGKSILSSFIEDTGQTRSVKTKPEKVYKLIKNIPKDMVDKARETVGEDWLKDFEEKSKKK